LAVRESIFAVIFNDVVHFQVLMLAYTRFRPKFLRHATHRHRCNIFTIRPIRDGRTKGHLQLEDGLVRWGEAHHAISSALLDTLKNERQEMRKLIATLVNRRRRSNATNHRRPHCLDANATCIGEDARLNTSSAVNANFNSDPPGREIAEVKLTHRVPSYQGSARGPSP
jgi:hypothetical protein